MLIMIQMTREGERAVFRVAGWLSRAGAEDLRRACDAVDLPVTLDLAGLRWADQDGLRELRRLVAWGAGQRGASPFIQLLIECAVLS